MAFIHDTKRTLTMAVDLVNTARSATDGDAMSTPADLAAFLAAHPYTGTIQRDAASLAQVRDVRSRIGALWDVDRAGAVPLVNAMLADGEALPRLVIHDEYDWHIHATSDESPLATRMMVETAMAFIDVIRSDEYERVRVCGADDCDRVYIDYSKNGSKRYCDAGNCGNRMNVIAYRARKAARESA